MLDRDEFAVAMFLIDHKIGGNDIPDSLPERLVPPSKVRLFNPMPREDERRGRPSDDYSGGGYSGTSQEASYSRDSGYDRDPGYNGGGASRMESSYRGTGDRGGMFDEDKSDRSFRGGYSARHADEYDDDSSHLSSFIDRGH